VPTYLTLVFILLLCGLLTAVATIVIMAISLLRPPRMTDGKALWVLRRVSPADVGLRSQDIYFDVRDEQTGRPIRIAGWWIANPEANGRFVVMLHGYADAKIGAMAWAPLWHQLGFNILAIDLRAHGQSGGTYSTAGFWERHDVNQVIDQIRAHRPAETRQLVLFGVSVGAIVAAAVGAIRDDVSAIVLDSPYARFANTAMAHMERLGAPARLFQQAALLLSQRIAASDFSAVRLADLLANVFASVFVIFPAADALISQDDQREIIAAMSTRKSTKDQLWIVQDCGHLAARHTQADEYERRLKAFLDAAMLGK
jgi:hypothetical protein